jgi:leucyl aminopeptidase
VAKDGRSKGDGRGGKRVTRAVAGFDPIPSRRAEDAVAIEVTARIPGEATVIGIPTFSDGAVPNRVPLDRATLEASGFAAARGQTLVLPRVDGPTIIETGVGPRATIDMAAIRDAAAAFAMAAVRHDHLVVDLTGIDLVDAATAGQAVVEGVLLARYRYRVFRDIPNEAHLRGLTIVGDRGHVRTLRSGAAKGEILARATNLARDLGNTPATHLTATRFADIAEAIGPETGLEVEVFDQQDLIKMGCGGLIGVNAGSHEEARLIKLTYTPRGRSRGHLALVGKGIMYDAGGISLKPSDAMHALMKLDMSGAGDIFAAMTTLRDLGCKATVTGYLMCTDNMPSGTATRLGDVLTIRGGKTVEVVNADAEGRLVMADGLALAVEDGADAIVTVATLTGAAMRTFGSALAPVLGNSPELVAQLRAAGDAVDEPLWELPLVRAYRPQLDSKIADIKNMGGENAGTITAGLFLEDFVDGTPFGHLDICGPMVTGHDDGWRPTGATAFSTRLLAVFATEFRKPAR